MIKILIKSASRYPVNRKRIREKIRRFLQTKGLIQEVEVSLSFVGDRKMKKLNSRYRKKRETTDVLSFSLTEGEISFPENENNILRLGDIVISYPQARKQAGQYNILVDEEIDKLVEHGLMHLLGIHH